MTVPRKHAEVIKAWADGAEIECRWPWTNSQPGKWSDWYPSKEPSWNPNHEYRVKPEAVKLVLYGKVANPRHVGSSIRSTKHVLDAPCWTEGKSGRDNVCATFEDGVLVKLELLK